MNNITMVRLLLFTDNIPDYIFWRHVDRKKRDRSISQSDSLPTPEKHKSRRQHQADKGGLPIIESSFKVSE